MSLAKDVDYPLVDYRLDTASGHVLGHYVTPSTSTCFTTDRFTIDEAVLELELAQPRAGQRRSQTMDPRLDVITLAVDDLERALVFYRDGLGLRTKGVVATDLVDEKTDAAGAIAIFKLESELILSLYPRSELAKDAAVPAGPPQSGEFSLGQLVASRADVDRILERAAAAGASVTPPHDRPWGIYSGYFRDLDGHLWEIIWNPGRTSDSD